MRDNPEIVWEMYQALEKEFLSYLEYVPFTEQHYDVWSFPLVNLLNNIGSSVDSFCKNAIQCVSFNDFPDIDSIRSNSHSNMNDYKKIFESRYMISNKQIFELKTSTPIFPFKEWQNAKAPYWWQNYTKIKHNRFENKEKATLKTTMDALSGLFTLFLTHKETLSVLIDYDIIIRNGLEKEYCKGLLLKGEPITDGPMNRIYAKTILFGYVYNVIGYSQDDHNKKRVLAPNYPGYG